MRRVVLACLLLAVSAAPAAAIERDQLGTDFWAAFPANLDPSPSLKLHISGPTATTGSVTGAGISGSTPFTVTPGAVTTVTIPSADALAASNAAGPAVHVVAQAEVAVVAEDASAQSADTYVVAPTDTWGTQHIVAAGANSAGVSSYSDLAVVAGQDGTGVTVTTDHTVGGSTAHVTTLAAGQAFYLHDDSSASADLTGSSVTSTKPVMVIAGHECGEVPANAGFCDQMLEAIPPVATWGRRVAIAPGEVGRTPTDVVRIMGSVDGTTLQFDPAVAGAPASVNAGKTVEFSPSTPTVVTASDPVLATQYSRTSSVGEPAGDASELSVPAVEGYAPAQTVVVPPGYTANYARIFAPSSAAGSVTVDGTAPAMLSFSPIGGSGLSVAQVPLAAGAHQIAAPVPIGVETYGYSDFVEYAHGWSLLGEAGLVAAVTLVPATVSHTIGSGQCLTATVKSAGGTPLPGVRVDFTGSGPNAPAGQTAFTAADGTASYCYAGTAAGTDTITATARPGVEAAAAVTWAQPTPTPTPSPTASPSVTATPTATPAPGLTPSELLTAIGFRSPARPDRKGVIRFGTATCPRVCGALTLSATLARRPAGHGARRLTSGARARVLLTLTKAARKRLAKRHRLAVAFSARLVGPSGTAVVARRTLALRR